MKYLKITFVRVVLSFFGGNMLSNLIVIYTTRESVPVFVKLVLMGMLYYGLTLYVNNRR